MARGRQEAGPGTARLFALVLALCWPAALAAQADFSGQTLGPGQTVSVLVLSQERLLTDSAPGQALLSEEAALRAAHKEEGERLDAELEAEERELAELRTQITDEDFQARAVAFDEKVVRIRQDHREKSEALGREVEERRKAFFAQVVPIVAEIMRERGASLVFERRNILFTGPGVDITDEVIRRIDNSGSFQ